MNVFFLLRTDIYGKLAWFDLTPSTATIAWKNLYRNQPNHKKKYIQDTIYKNFSLYTA